MKIINIRLHCDGGFGAVDLYKKRKKCTVSYTLKLEGGKLNSHPYETDTHDSLCAAIADIENRAIVIKKAAIYIEDWGYLLTSWDAIKKMAQGDLETEKLEEISKQNKVADLVTEWMYADNASKGKLEDAISEITE